MQEVREGDIIWIPAGVSTGMAQPTPSGRHIAITESLDGKSVEWMEKVEQVQHDG